MIAQVFLLHRCFGYTIYKNILEAPGCYVLRGYDVTDDGKLVSVDQALAVEMTDKALALMRETLNKEGYIMIPRDESDDPVIVESWIAFDLEPAEDKG